VELLFISLGGAVIGLLARYLLPQRHRHGSVLIPAIATATAAIVWVALTWAGMKWNGGWIWFVTIAVTVVVSVVVDLAVGEVRKRRDDRMLVALSKGAVHVTP
jgi:CHASE2 domain-containing sensor protein